VGSGNLQKMLKEDFLESYWQYKLEEAAAYNATPNPEEEPYKNFYKARKIYQEILADSFLDEA
jgi:glutamine synthetase